MTSIFFYLLRFSISIATMYLFYRIFLRPLTFYRWNRFFLIGYSTLSFIIPFLDIMPWLAGSGFHDSRLLNSIPAIDNYADSDSSGAAELTSLSEWNGIFWLGNIFMIGAMAMFTRLALQYRSLWRLRARSTLIKINQEMHLYETSADVSPFSFGRSIYFNRSKHTVEELQRILQHEFVHVKQRHTVDLIIAEMICILNWFNPFAWLIRHSIRQNLEFIADQDVLEKGVDRKEYQYLLLKVVGLAPYRIVNAFNLPNLKKRIVMMNKMKSAKLNLARFLFVLPMLAVLLLAFRNNNIVHFATGENAAYSLTPDTLPPAVIRKDPSPSPVAPKPPVAPVAPVVTEGMIIRKIKEPAVPPSEKPSLHAEEVKINLDVKKEQPLIIVNQVEQPASFEVKSIKPEDIEYMSVYKDKSSIEKYGEKGKFGVIEIKTRTPLYIIDGVEQPASDNILSTIDQNKIQSITVIKDKSATEKYGEKGKNGVIEIIMKKQ
ncbi:MAG: M56 family metallopeptidase [Flavitalea sp.]